MWTSEVQVWSSPQGDQIGMAKNMKGKHCSLIATILMLFMNWIYIFKCEKRNQKINVHRNSTLAKGVG